MGDDQNQNIPSCDQDEAPLSSSRPDNETTPLISHLSHTPVCRQFWKAGNDGQTLTSKSPIQNNKNYLHVHPRFLHSNATSHKWVFGAVAELLDNAIDEIQNGATFVTVDKISNPKDGNPALLIQDDGSGMNPDVIRKCVSFGFSDKKTSAIGQYGNGFKTSTMRLGADVIVFSRHVGYSGVTSAVTQSVGLLSYTYLMHTGADRIVVPLVNYEHNKLTGKFEPLQGYDADRIKGNYSVLLEWSPYATETELLNQFDSIGDHGTKIVIYNLWESDVGLLELDFETSSEDIRLPDSILETATHHKSAISQSHIGNQFHYSLRVYLSILYLRIPENFRILLRGKAVIPHNLADDLKFLEFIRYKPHTGGVAEAQVITTIGFIKEAPQINIHGFNVYHKNRLILPFWRVVNYSHSVGRGVVGVLEANFVQPTHNKQDFEKTSLFQKLELRLKQMACEYWDRHCELIGYKSKKNIPSLNSSASGMKRTPCDIVVAESPIVKRRPVTEANIVDAGHSISHTTVALDSGPNVCSENNIQPKASGMKIVPYDTAVAESPIVKGVAVIEADIVDAGHHTPVVLDSGPNVCSENSVQPKASGMKRVPCDIAVAESAIVTRPVIDADVVDATHSTNYTPVLLDSSKNVCSDYNVQPKASGMKKVPCDIAVAESPIVERRPLIEADIVDAGHGAHIQAELNIKRSLMDINGKLREKLKLHEKMTEELNEKVVGMKAELTCVQHEYAKMFEELKLLDPVKDKNMRGRSNW